MRVVLHSNRAQALLRLARFVDAEGACSVALALNVNHVKSLFRRARARLGLGRMQAAQEDARLVLRLSSANEESRQLMADVGLGDEVLREEPAAGRRRRVAGPPAADKSAAPSADAGYAATARQEPDGRGARAPADAFARAARRGFGGGASDGGLYDDMPDVDMDAVIKERERDEALRAAKAADADARAARAPWPLRMWAQALAVLGCKPRRKDCCGRRCRGEKDSDGLRAC
jgi:hypothetical protein